MRKEGPFQELCQSDAHSQKNCWILFNSMMQVNSKLWMFLVFWSVAMAFWCKNPWMRSRTTNKNTQVSWHTDFLSEHCCSIGNVLPWMSSLSTGQPTKVTAAGFVLGVSTSRPSSKVWKYSSAITYKYSYLPHTGKAN